MTPLRALERNRRPLALLMALSALALFLMPASMVLCFDADGCFALEAKSEWSTCRERMCCEHQEGEQGAREGISADGGQCRLCNDIPLRSSNDPVLISDMETPQRFEPPRISPALLPLLLEGPAISTIPRRAPGSPGDVLVDAHFFLASVRLLI